VVERLARRELPVPRPLSPVAEAREATASWLTKKQPDTMGLFICLTFVGLVIDALLNRASARPELRVLIRTGKRDVQIMRSRFDMPDGTSELGCHQRDALSSGGH
jgi:hypothetical protein